MTGKLIIGIGLMVLIVLAMFFPQAAWQAQRVFGWNDRKDRADVQRVLVENEALKAEVARLTPLAEVLSLQWPKDLRPVDVFSRYPFGIRNQIVIGAGTANGISSGDPVFLVSGPDVHAPVLIGTVIDARETSATVRTLFDPEFKTAVRVGLAGADALLIGGPEPKLSLIAKDAAVQPGDIVVTASPKLPLDMPLATVGVLEPAEDQAFKNATLLFGYDIGNIRIVALRTSTP